MELPAVISGKHEGAAEFTAFEVKTPLILQRLPVIVESEHSPDVFVDVGVYTLDGIKLVSSGPSALNGRHGLIWLDITDTYLNPGKFFITGALSH